MQKFIRSFALGISCGVTQLALAAPVYTVGVQDYENYLPYSEYKHGEYRGLGRAILDAFADKYGYVFRYIVYPLKRRDMQFVAGNLDFAFPDNPNWITDQKKGVKISYAPMLDFTDGVLVRPDDVGKPISHIKTLGLPLGFTPYPYSSYIESGAIKLEPTSTYDKLYQKLVLKRLDGAYMNTRVAQYYWSHIHRRGEVPVRYDASLPHATGYHFLSSIKYPAMIEEFKKFMVENKTMIENLKKQYQF
ncbi:substrate-binding periplasmic protein [Rugamonas apoptosis]|uniref:Transporter substrate-binding domain-containing protein n=1 Tax=Rugamonas apoptosis TaxID=2758570 RepID=A0A7W2FF77_9BURK|nr:transporter substrate-binding domain-containing protein [Rugamonas apoptosis]MBA5690576.1 transporter substrate-binding domain-containing protein [Rugamonas apoptosis]